MRQALRWAARISGWALFAAVAISFFYNGIAAPETRGPSLTGLVAVFSVALAHRLSLKATAPEKILPLAFVPPLLTGLGYGLWAWLLAPPPFTGPLTPANDPTPAFACPDRPRPGDLTIALGTNRVLARGQGPFIPLMAQDCSGPMLFRGPRGLSVKAFGYNWDNDIAYVVRDNRLDAALVPGLHMRRPDAHTVMLLDRFDQEVIYVRYLNPGAVRLRGRFLCGERPQVVVKDDRVLVGGIRVSGVMFGQHRTRGHACGVTTGAEPGLVVTGR